MCHQPLLIQRPHGEKPPRTSFGRGAGGRARSKTSDMVRESGSSLLTQQHDFINLVVGDFFELIDSDFTPQWESCRLPLGTCEKQPCCK